MFIKDVDDTCDVLREYLWVSCLDRSSDSAPLPIVVSWVDEKDDATDPNENLVVSQSVSVRCFRTGLSKEYTVFIWWMLDSIGGDAWLGLGLRTQLNGFIRKYTMKTHLYSERLAMLTLPTTYLIQCYMKQSHVTTGRGADKHVVQILVEPLIVLHMWWWTQRMGNDLEPQSELSPFGCTWDSGQI